MEIKTSIFPANADDTTPLITGMNFEQIIPDLERILTDISQCFMNNNLKANTGKFIFSVHMRAKR